MDEKLKKVLDQINALRALATSNNPHEAASAAAQAARLIDKYSISEAELEAASGSAGEKVIAEEDPLVTAPGSRIAQWKFILASGLASHFGVYLIREKVRGKIRLMLSGRPSDVAVVRYFYSWVSQEIERLCRNANEALPGGKGGVAWCTTYKNGAAIGVCIQLKKLKEETRPTVSTQALVLLDARMEEAKRARLALYGKDVKVRTAQFNWGSDPNAYAQGNRDGQQINLGRHLGAGDGKVVTDNKALPAGGVSSAGRRSPKMA